MAMLYRLESFPPSNGFSFILCDVDDALCGATVSGVASWGRKEAAIGAYASALESSAAPLHDNEELLQPVDLPLGPFAPEPCSFRCDDERGSATAAASPSQPAPGIHVKMSPQHQNADASCFKSPFGLAAVQHCVLEVDSGPQPTANEEGAWAEDASPQASCGLNALQLGPECLPNEVPVAPAEPAPPAEPAAAALAERASATTLVLTTVEADPDSPASELPVGHLGQQLLQQSPQQQRLPAGATPAASSVCRRGAGDDDTDDGEDDAAEEITPTAAKGAESVIGVKRKSLGCLPDTMTSGRGSVATSTADDEMSETVEAVEEEADGEPELSTLGGPCGDSPPPAAARPAPSANGPSEWADEAGYMSAAAAESPRAACGRTGAGRPRRGRPAATASARGLQPPAMAGGRGARRAAAGAAAAVAAAARFDVVDEEPEVREEGDGDGDEEWVAGGRTGRAPAKRPKTGVKATRPAGRQASGKSCRECGVTSTPQWRQGPEGPCTLCNACGVRYMKALSSKAASARGPNAKRR